jgi:hypothetical protein
LGGRGRQISEFKASLVYRLSSRRARDTQRSLEKPKKKKKKKRRRKKLNRDILQSFIAVAWMEPFLQYRYFTYLSDSCGFVTKH